MSGEESGERSGWRKLWAEDGVAKGGNRGIDDQHVVGEFCGWREIFRSED